MTEPHTVALPDAAKLLESMSEGVSLSTEDGYIVYTNAAEDRMFGYAPGELIGKHVSVQNAYTPEENARIVAEVIYQLKEHGRWEGEWLNVKKDRTCFITEARITSVEIGGRTHWLCVQRDVTEARTLTSELEVSKERARLATEGANLGVYDLDLTTGRGTWSRTAFEQLGLDPPSSLEGSYELWRSAVHSDDLVRVEAEHEAAMAAGSTWRIEYRTRYPEDDPRWLEVYGRFDRQPNGSVRSIGVAVDVTDRKRAEMSLAASERRLRAVLEAVPEPVLSVDAEWRITLVNRAAEQFFGFGHGEALGRDLLEAIPSTAGSEIESRLREVMETNSAVTYEGPSASRPDRFVLINAAPKEGGGFAACFSDITERKLAESQLQRMNERLEELVLARTQELEQAQEALRQAQKLEALGQLTGGIAHDFNNVLAAIIGSLDVVIRRGSLGERERRFVDNAFSAAQRAAKLTSQLLAFARMQKLEIMPLDLVDALTQMDELLARSLGPQIEIKYHLHARRQGVLSDRTQLEMAILNLALNARDAMFAGGKLYISTSEVRVESDPELPSGTYIEVAVQDDGPGMSPEVLSKALDPFFTTKGTGKGTGLGLSQAYGLARQSGGTLRIESQPGVGTVVRILLRPAEAAAEPLLEIEYDGPALTNAQILVVDDDDQVREMLTQSLVELGFSVTSASDGTSGMERLERARPDLLIVDYAMPGMNGAVLARNARELHPGLPVLFVSGYADSAELEASAPEAPVLRKPFRMNELSTLVDQMLGKRTRERDPAKIRGTESSVD